MDDQIKLSRKHLVSYSILAFLLVFIFSFLVLFLIEREVRTTRINELQNQELRVVELEKDFLGREFNMLLSDLHYLHYAFENDLTINSDYSKVATNWAEFSTQRRIYDQIRFLDANGDERIRINISGDGGYAVPEKDLQNKKDRYYFTETIKLKEDSVYVSPLDLNIERGEIEIPYKPMIRISTPIYDEQGTLKGIIVLNYLANNVLTGFRELAGNSQGEIVLLNEAGYRLSSSNPDKDWNFMFDEKKEDTFRKEYPNEWMSILMNEGQITTDKGLITATPVVLSHSFDSNYKIVLGDGKWYVVSVFERNQENFEYFNDDIWGVLVNVLTKNVFYFLLTGIISAIVGFLVYMNRKTYSKIKFYSEFDPLTKTLNRRAGIARLNELFLVNERRNFLVSLCYIDINGLKQVNDTLGHKLGDELISSVAEVIKRTIRAQDYLIRLGGDEFLIVFNGIAIDTAESVWVRIAKAYEQINNDKNHPYIISVSHGIVDFDNKQTTPVDSLIHAADEKMYKEKQIIKVNLNVIKGNS